MNTQKNEIFAFEKGRCILLRDFKNVQDNNKYDLGDQMTNLIQTISNLSQTVNQNAYILNTLHKKIDQNEFNFVNFLQQNNGNYLKYYDDGLQDKVNSINENEYVDFLIERNDILQQKNLESVSQNSQIKKNLDDKFENIYSQQSQICFQVNQIEQQEQQQQKKFDQMKKDLKQKLEKFQAEINTRSTVDSVTKINYSCKFQIEQLENMLIEKMNEMYKLMENKSSQKFSANFDSDDMQYQINVLNEQMQQQLSKNDSYDKLVQEFEASQIKQKKHTKIIKKLVKNKIALENKQKIENLENIVFKSEQNNVKMIKKNIKDVDMLKQQLELKIDKSQFFEFISENFVRSKDYQSFQNTILKNINDFKALQNDIQKNLQQFKYDLNDKIEDCFNIQENIDKKVEKNVQDILKIRSIESNGEKMYNSLEKKIEKLKHFFIDTYSQKLNSLTIAQGLKCLSCGERDLPFPPQSNFVQDENKNVYQMKENKRIDSALTKNTINTVKQNLDNQKNKFKLSTKNSALKSQQMQSYNSLTQKNYMIGPQIFNKQHQMVEHYFKTHLPVDQLIEKKLYRKSNNKRRPQTSISKFQS